MQRYYYYYLSWNYDVLPPLANRRLVRDFLLPALFFGKFGRYLEWVDRENPTEFRVIYDHKNSTNWTEMATAVFEAWDMLKGREERGIDYHTKARQRFKAALQKCPDLEKVSDPSEKHFEIYRIRTQHEIKEMKKNRRRLRGDTFPHKVSTTQSPSSYAVAESSYLQSFISHIQTEDYCQVEKNIIEYKTPQFSEKIPLDDVQCARVSSSLNCLKMASEGTKFQHGDNFKSSDGYMSEREVSWIHPIQSGSSNPGSSCSQNEYWNIEVLTPPTQSASDSSGSYRNEYWEVEVPNSLEPVYPDHVKYWNLG